MKSRCSGRLPIPSPFLAWVFCICLLSAFAMPREAQAGPNEWTWVSGSNLPNQPGVYGTLGTPAAANVPGWRTGAASWTDKSGNLWLFGGEGLSANFAGTPGAPASLNANGQATYTTAALADGSSSITAAYNGNSTFLSSNADSFTQLVLDFGFLTGSSQSATIFPGQSASFKFAIAPKGTFSGTITFSASGLPPGATASFNPATLTPGSTANDVVMTVQTAPFSAAAQPVSPQLTKSPLLLGLLLPLFGIRRARREFKRRMLFLMALLSFGIAIAISGCGGDGFFNQPPHAYAITVKATSGALQHTTTVNLTVQ